MCLRKLAQLYTTGKQEVLLIGEIAERATFFVKNNSKNRGKQPLFERRFLFCPFVVLRQKEPFFIKMTKEETDPSCKETR